MWGVHIVGLYGHWGGPLLLALGMVGVGIAVYPPVVEVALQMEVEGYEVSA